MKIGIIVAMDKEFAQLRTLLNDCRTERQHHKDFVVGTLGHLTVVVQQCGIGKVNSAIGAVELIDLYQPDLVVSTGVAGGADPTLNVQDVVVGTAYVYHDAYCGEQCADGQLQGMPARYATPTTLEGAISRTAELCAQTDTAHLRQGLIVSGDWFVDTKEKMRAILTLFPEATAVDMESCSIAQTCHVYGVPFVIDKGKSILKLGTKNQAPMSEGHLIFISHYSIIVLSKNTLPHIFFTPFLD